MRADEREKGGKGKERQRQKGGAGAAGGGASKSRHSAGLREQIDGNIVEVRLPKELECCGRVALDEADILCSKL